MNKLKEFLSTDNIRGLKILEMFQYSIIFYIITIVIAKFCNEFIFISDKEHIEKMSKTQLLFSIFFELSIIVILLFYIRKLSLIIPSISNYINPKFIPHTTIDYVIHIITIFIFLESLKNLHYKIEKLVEIKFFKNT
jgi:hypothetical protein